jgi:hypothetical protein
MPTTDDYPGRLKHAGWSVGHAAFPAGMAGQYHEGE